MAVWGFYLALFGFALLMSLRFALPRPSGAPAQAEPLEGPAATLETAAPAGAVPGTSAAAPATSLAPELPALPATPPRAATPARAA